MPSRVSPFRSGGGLLTPAGSTGRPGRSAVGLGPTGLEGRDRGPEVPEARGRPDAATELAEIEIAAFDGWMKSRPGHEAAEAVTATIRAARQFHEWDFSQWWASHRNDAEAIEGESCLRFFRRPFNGALVERTARREIVGGAEPGPWWEEPLVVRAYAEAGELTGFERPGRQPAPDVPVVSAVPRLAHGVEELVRKGCLLTVADERLVQVWFVLTMRDVVFSRGNPLDWAAVARREVDRRSPAILQKVVWMIDGAWRPF